MEAVTPDVVARYADRPLPRYTSYPTAPHFAPGMTPELYADWLGALPADQTVSLYLHVPFCRSMCWYCGCHTTITAREASIVFDSSGITTQRDSSSVGVTSSSVSVNDGALEVT